MLTTAKVPAHSYTYIQQLGQENGSNKGIPQTLLAHAGDKTAT